MAGPPSAAQTALEGEAPNDPASGRHAPVDLAADVRDRLLVDGRGVPFLDRREVGLAQLISGAGAPTMPLQVSGGRVEGVGGDVEALRQRQMNQIPARRFGDPAEFGEMCAFLCGARAGYLTGQNILLDGGQFPGLL